MTSLRTMTEAARLNCSNAEAVAHVSGTGKLTNLQSASCDGADSPRFALFHSDFSICSNKVRTILAELGKQYLSYPVNLPMQRNYAPEYVRLRLRASQAKNAKSFACGFNGTSSVSDNGFDALVVPTLVDFTNDMVVADSFEICKYLAREGKDTLVLSDDNQKRVLELCEQVDKFPHVALLYGTNPNGDDVRPKFMQEKMKASVNGLSMHDHKLKKLHALWETVKGEDPLLDMAYDAKIKKEEAAKGFVASAEKMNTAIQLADRLVGDLEETLRANGGPYLLGNTDAPTMADLFWAITLFRIDWLGYAPLLFRGDEKMKTEKRAHVIAFADLMYHRPSIRNAVIDWSPAMPSEHVMWIIEQNRE